MISAKVKGTKNLIEKWRFGALSYITTQKLDLIDEEIRTNPKIIIKSHDNWNHFLAPNTEIIILQKITR
ncbi:MAG: hypothetical protein ACTSWC_04800 [Promethearchaeota archaeon]